VAVSPGIKGVGREVTSHLHLVPRIIAWSYRKAVKVLGDQGTGR
jgi:hypothetical protein